MQVNNKFYVFCFSPAASKVNCDYRNFDVSCFPAASSFTDPTSCKLQTLINQAVSSPTPVSPWAPPSYPPILSDWIKALTYVAGETLPSFLRCPPAGKLLILGYLGTHLSPLSLLV